MEEGRKAGIELKERGPVDDKAKQERQRQLKAISWAVKYFQASLIQNKAPLEYATKTRGLTKSTIQDFQIGYAPDDWNALSNFLIKKKFSAFDLIKAGLAGQKDGRSSIYDLYRGRLMFTICDAQGTPVGFTGRVLAEDALPKYLNTPQTDLYDKSRVIFGLHLAKEAIRQGDEAVLVEGNMDVVASHQASVKQVVAASGTALTVVQLKTLGRLTKNIKICFDADAAGIRATERVIELSQNLGVTLRVVRLPDAKDPDELIKKGVEGWKRAIADAQYVVDYLFEQLEQNYDITTATGKRQYSDRLAATLRQLGDPVEQDHYVKLLATKLDISETAIKDKLAKADRAGSGGAREVKPAATVSRPQPKSVKQRLEESVLAISMAYPEVRLSLDDLTPAHFSDPDHQLILEVLQQIGTAPVGEVAARLPNNSDYVKILALRGEEQYGSFAPADRSFEAFQLVGRLQTATNKDTKTKLSQKLREAEAKGDADLAKRLLTQFQALITEEE